MTELTKRILADVEQPGNVRIQVPEYFNFGFDIIDHYARHADKNAFLAVDHDAAQVREFRFSDLSRASNRFANALRDAGIQRGEFAVVILPRIPEWYQTIVGCIKAGVVCMPGTNLLTARDIAQRVKQSGATTAIVSPGHADKIESIRATCPTLENLILVGGQRDGWLSSAGACAAASDALDADTAGHSRSDEMMMAYFTSGTTSGAKLVPRNHDYALAHLLTGTFWMDLQRSDIHWTLSDTGWAKAAWGLLFGPWMCGATMVLYDGAGDFDADLHLKLIDKLGVTTFCAPPTIYRLFAQLPLADYELGSLRHSMGAGEPLNPEVIRIWHEATGNIVHDGYGQTETVNIVANIPGMEVRYGSMGKPVPGFDVQVIDDHGQAVADDVIGHIAMRVTDPPPLGLFDGYYLDAETRDHGSFRHGWYYTGDTATRDADGYIWFVGRADDVITSAGYRISPFEVESILLEHNAVSESAVVAKPDQLRGEIVKAFIVLANGYRGDEKLVAELQEFVKANTAPYKYPREIEFRDHLPKTISGKIRRVELRAEEPRS